MIVRGIETDGEKIREGRRRLGMTQEQFARQIQCDPKSIRKAERGGRMDLPLLTRIAKALETSVAELDAEASQSDLSAEQAVGVLSQFSGRNELLAKFKSTIDAAVGPEWIGTKGYAHHEVRDLYEISLRVAEELNIDRTASLRGLWLCSILGADYRAAIVTARELQELAQRDVDVALADGSLATALCYTGHLQEGCDLLSQPNIMSMWNAYPQYGEWVGHLTHLALGWVLMGRWKDADSCIEHCFQKAALAEGMNAESIIPHTTLFATHMAFMRGDLNTLPELASNLTKSKSGNPFYSVMGMIYQSWIASLTERTAESLTQFRQGRQILVDMGCDTGTSMLSCMEAEALMKSGEHEEAERLLREAIEFAEQRSERFFLPEAYRLLGNLQTTTDQKNVSKTLTRALEISEEMGSRWWSIRTAIDLHRFQNDAQSKNWLPQIIEGWPDGQDAPEMLVALESMNS